MPKTEDMLKILSRDPEVRRPRRSILITYSPHDGGCYVEEFDHDTKKSRFSVEIYPGYVDALDAVRRGVVEWEPWS